MNRHKMTVNEIYNYLSSKNFNLSSDRVLREPQNNPDVIWNILVFLTSNLKDSKYEQIEPTLQYLINTDEHKNSLKKIKEYITISDTLSKITGKSEDYPVKEILKPERDTLLEKLTLLINANKFVEKVVKEYEPQITEIKMKRQIVNELKKKLESRNEEIEEIKNIKERERPIYEEKMANIENLNKDLNYKKKEKLDVINSMQMLENELKKKTKMVDEGSYAIDDLNIKIKQLEREVIKNAPKLKKEKYSLMEQVENLLKEKREMCEFWEYKIEQLRERLKSFEGIKERSKTFKIEQYKAQIDNQISELENLQAQMQMEENGKYNGTNTKKETLKNIQNMEREKNDLIEQTKGLEKSLLSIEKAENTLLDDQRKHSIALQTLQEKNEQSINQYRVLESKIELKVERFRNNVEIMKNRWDEIERESMDIVNKTFSDFN